MALDNNQISQNQKSRNQISQNQILQNQTPLRPLTGEKFKSTRTSSLVDELLNDIYEQLNKYEWRRHPSYRNYPHYHHCCNCAPNNQSCDHSQGTLSRSTSNSGTGNSTPTDLINFSFDGLSGAPTNSVSSNSVSSNSISSNSISSNSVPAPKEKDLMRIAHHDRKNLLRAKRKLFFFGAIT